MYLYNQISKAKRITSFGSGAFFMCTCDCDNLLLTNVVHKSFVFRPATIPVAVSVDYNS